MSPEQAKTQSAATRFRPPDSAGWTRTWRMWSRPSSARASTFSPASILTATGAENWKPTRCSRPTTSICTLCLRAAIRAGSSAHFTEMMRYQNEDGSWSIYPGGPGNISLSVKCYFSCQADGHWRRRPAAHEVPRVDSRPRRRGGLQHLHQNVSLRAGPVRLRRRPRHSPGDRSLSQLVLLQYLRDLLLVALDPCAAGHHLRQKAVQEDPPRAGHR